jgi:DNA mismatch repair protein MutL
MAAAAEHRDELSSLGFLYELKERSAHLLAIPDGLTPPEAERLFVTLCADMREDGSDPLVSERLRREKMLYQMACKAAIKGGRSYDSAHIEWLVREVLSLPDVTVCPHGRPIAFYLTKSELDRRFDRLK